MTWVEILQGIGGLGIIGIALKALVPILLKRADADAARAAVDETMHRLYNEMLNQSKELTDSLAKANAEVVKITYQLHQTQEELKSVRAALADAERRCLLIEPKGRSACAH